MAGWFSKVKQSLAEGTGFAEKTLDPDVIACADKMALLEKDVTLLKKSLQNYSDHLTDHLPRTRHSMTEVMLRLGKTFVADGPQYSSYAEAHEVLDTVCVEKLRTIFSAAVLQPLEEWIGTFAEVKAGERELDKLRQDFDHFRSKLDGLKKEKDASILAGKVYPAAAEEKFQRNVAKLKDVRFVQPALGEGCANAARTLYAHTRPPPPPPPTLFRARAGTLRRGTRRLRKCLFSLRKLATSSTCCCCAPCSTRSKFMTTR
jgi:hypothetical protein